ncbi:MAG TPA: ABC transporter permease [Terriglobia bacterium]|nr:ABC transporter permease [Terriglobia bacterium]
MNWTRFFRRKRWDAERFNELEAYVDIETDENMARGLSPEEARYAARRKLGNPALIREEIYTMNSLGFFEALRADLRYALRTLRRSPAFTLLAVASLALGIGGNAAIFSLLDGVLLRPLPYPELSRLVRVTDYYPQGALVALQQRSRTMDIAGFTTDSEFNLTGQGEAMRLVGSSVSSNLFTVLQSGPELGRIFRPGEDRPGQDRIALLSHELWEQKFGGDPGVIGRFITLDGVNRQVVGVMPSEFDFPSADAQVWVPMHIDPRDSFATWNTGFVPLAARLRPGFTLAQARGEIRPLISRVLPLFPYTMFHSWNQDAAVIPLEQDMTSDSRGRLIVLQFAVGLVLLIACANVAGLLVSRAANRQKEIALRVALGAGPSRIIRQLLTESVVLSLFGAVAGLALASFTLADFKVLLPQQAFGLASAHVDWRVALVIAAVALLTGLAFGLAPALGASRFNLAATIKTGGRRSSATASVRLRSTLIAVEVALAAILAVSAGLLIKSLWMLAQVNPGFSPGHILTARITPDSTLCQSRPACVALYEELLRRTEQATGVSEVTAVNALPLSGETPSLPTEAEGHPVIAAEEGGSLLWAGAVTPGYFHLMRIPIVAGRAFADSDSEKSAPVVILSAATARRFWPGENPIGKHIRPLWAGAPWRTVVGVAADVRQYDLANHSPAGFSGAVYMPYAQAVLNNGQLPTGMTLLVRTGADPATTAGRIREIVRDFNPNVPVSEIRTMQEVVWGSTSQSRSMMWLFASFAAAALLLAAVGIYGVISYSTSQRTFEIGMRMALGASRGNVFSLVLGQSVKLVLGGLAVGLAAALAVTRMLNAFLYGIRPTDPLTFLAVGALLIAVALIAGYLPARRATRVDPMIALRNE